MNKKLAKFKKGYTLLELVIVIAITAVIMGMVTAFIFFFSNQFSLNKKIENNYYSAVTLKNYINNELDKNIGNIVIDSSINDEDYLFSVNKSNKIYLYKYLDNNFLKVNIASSNDYEVLYTPGSEMDVVLTQSSVNTSKLTIEIKYSKNEDTYEASLSFIRYIN